MNEMCWSDDERGDRVKFNPRDLVEIINAPEMGKFVVVRYFARMRNGIPTYELVGEGAIPHPDTCIQRNENELRLVHRRRPVDAEWKGTTVVVKDAALADPLFVLDVYDTPQGTYLMCMSRYGLSSDGGPTNSRVTVYHQDNVELAR